MKSFILITLGLIATSLGCEANKQKVFTKPLGLDTQDLCSRMPDGVLIADSQDCQLFYYCLNNVAEAVRCHPGYYFDQETSYCLRGICPVAAGHKRCNPRHEQFTRIEGRCNAFSVCHDGMLFELECPYGHYFNSDKKTCVEIQNDIEHKCACVMPEFTAIVNERNCRTYFVCTEGQALLQHCEKGNFYNENLNTCVADVRGVCGVANVPQDIDEDDVQKPIPKPELHPKPIHERPQREDAEDNKSEITDKHTEHKPTVSDVAKQEFLDDIHEQLIEKKKLQVQKHKEKVEIYEKCILNEQTKSEDEQPVKIQHENPKPSQKESEPEIKPEHKQPKPNAQKPSNGVYHKLHSKFIVL